MNDRWWREGKVEVALIFALFGLLAIGGAAVYPARRSVLFTLYWTLLFVAVLFYFLTPEEYVRAPIAERICAELMANEAALVAAYDLQDTLVYLPEDTESSRSDPPARLFVPGYAGQDFPSEIEPESRFVVSDAREQQGLCLLPTGGRLFREFESVLDGDLSETPDELSIQLADGLSEGLDLADRVTPNVRPTERRADFEITGSVYGPVDRFDHPVQSFLAVGLAIGLDRPVIAETVMAEGHSDYLVSCQWNVEDRVDETRSLRDRQSFPSRFEFDSN